MRFGRSLDSGLPRSRRQVATRPLSLAGWIGIAALSLILFWTSVATLVAFYHVTLIIAFATATVQCATVALAVVLPKTATALQLGAVFGMGFAAAQALNRPWPLPIVALAVLSAFLCVIGVHQRWIFSIVVWWLSFGTLVAIIVSNPLLLSDTDRWGSNLLIDATVTLLVLGGSVVLGQRRRISDQLAAARRDVELEQALRRYGEERSRIARELHDVVAHSMSIVHIQATSAKFRLDGLDPRTAAEFDDIARSARNALREMRQLLGALRPDDAGVERDPQPQLSNIETLIRGAARVGTRATLSIAEDAASFTPVVQLAIYRTVQEALSNAVRHAPRADAVIQIGKDEKGSAVVSVQNAAPSGSKREFAVVSDSGGMGLRGMHERVTLLGGTLTHGPTDQGGYGVVATIPFVADRTEELP